MPGPTVDPAADPPTLVVLRALALGDLLTAVPALRSIRRAFPAHRRFLTAPVWLRPLVEHADLADVCLDAAGGGDGARWRPHELRDRIALERAQIRGLAGAPAEPDVAINLRGVRGELHHALLRLRPRRFIGFANHEVPESAGGPEWDPDEHEVARYCRLLTESGLACDPGDLALAPPVTELSRRMAGCVVVHPGAGSPARQWPEREWIRVIGALTEAGLRVVLTGGRDELPLCGRVARAAGLPREDDLAGRLGVLELVALVGGAGLVLSTDTGIAHVAFATRTRSVTLYGPMPPSRWGPPDAERHQVIWHGRTGDPYADAPDATILSILSDEVIAAARRTLQLSS